MLNNEQMELLANIQDQLSMENAGFDMGTSTVYGGCDDYCVGRCANDCTSGCEGSCSGECAGSCKDYCSDVAEDYVDDKWGRRNEDD